MYINSIVVVNEITNDKIEINTLICILEIIKYLKAFYCDIFGSFVYNWRVLGEMKNETLTFRIDPVQIFQLINVLALHFSIIEEPSETTFNFYPCYTYTLTSHSVPTYPIKLRAILILKKMFKTTFPSDFDINLLSEDEAHLYVRTIPMSMRYIIDKITYIRERICNKRFCMLESLARKASSYTISQSVENAVDLLKNGWTMDDCLEKKSWIVVKWKDLTCNTHNYRIGLAIDKVETLKNCNECCLCQEKFEENDIVINTHCHHNFHWVCNGNVEVSGLRSWVKNQNKLCCPFCRADIF